MPNKKCLITLFIAIVFIIAGLIIFALDYPKKYFFILNTIGSLLSVYTVFCALQNKDKK